MKKCKVAIIGLGKMGLLHASILNTLENVELTALCEKKAVVRRFAGKIIPDIPFVADIEELKGMNLDAVFITTPEVSHFPVIRTIYEKRIAPNIFTEKPLATSYTHTQELCRLAEKYGGLNMVGYNRRYSVTFNKAKKLLEDGTVGDPVKFEGHAFESDFVGTRFDSETAAKRGAVCDLGCHVIDLALWLFGPLEVKEKILGHRNGNKPEDMVSFKLNGASSLEGDLSISRCMADYRLPEMALTINGTKGTIHVDEDSVNLKLENGDSSVWYKHDLDDNVPYFIGGTEYLREDRSFIAGILQESGVTPDFREASRVEAIIDRVFDDTLEAKPV